MSQCIAYNNDGSLCRAEATVFDTVRKGMVCHDHAPGPDRGMYIQDLLHRIDRLEQRMAHMDQALDRAQDAEARINKRIDALPALSPQPDAGR